VQDSRFVCELQSLSVSDKKLSAWHMVAGRLGPQGQLMDNNTLRPFELWMSVLLVAFLLYLAAGGFLWPVAAADGFGIPLVDPLDAFFLRVKGDRDLGAALAVGALLWIRDRRALGTLLLAFTIEPICDAMLLISDPRGRLAHALVVHGSAAVYCAFLSWRLLRKGALRR
jgi:hypothetical protein